jgi:hypothetical protein
MPKRFNPWVPHTCLAKDKASVCAAIGAWVTAWKMRSFPVWNWRLQHFDLNGSR